MPTCLFSHQVLIHSGDGPRGIERGGLLKYDWQHETVQHSLIDFYSKHSAHMLVKGKLTRRATAQKRFPSAHEWLRDLPENVTEHEGRSTIC